MCLWRACCALRRLGWSMRWPETLSWHCFRGESNTCTRSSRCCQNQGKQGVGLQASCSQPLLRDNCVISARAVPPGCRCGHRRSGRRRNHPIPGCLRRRCTDRLPLILTSGSCHKPPRYHRHKEPYRCHPRRSPRDANRDKIQAGAPNGCRMGAKDGYFDDWCMPEL